MPETLSPQEAARAALKAAAVIREEFEEANEDHGFAIFDAVRNGTFMGNDWVQQERHFLGRFRQLQEQCRKAGKGLEAARALDMEDETAQALIEAVQKTGELDDRISCSVEQIETGVNHPGLARKGYWAAWLDEYKQLAEVAARITLSEATSSPDNNSTQATSAAAEGKDVTRFQLSEVLQPLLSQDLIDKVQRYVARQVLADASAVRKEYREIRDAFHKAHNEEAWDVEPPWDEDRQLEFAERNIEVDRVFFKRFGELEADHRQALKGLETALALDVGSESPERFKKRWREEIVPSLTTAVGRPELSHARTAREVEKLQWWVSHPEEARREYANRFAAAVAADRLADIAASSSPGMTDWPGGSPPPAASAATQPHALAQDSQAKSPGR